MLTSVNKWSSLTIVNEGLSLRIFKGTDRLCKVVELSMQSCGKLINPENLQKIVLNNEKLE